MKKIILISILTIVSSLATESSLCIHLLNRTSFGVDTQALSKCLNDPSYSETISKILTFKPTLENHEKPKFARNIIKPKKHPKDLNTKERLALIKKRKESRLAMKKWLMRKLLTTQTPFEEKMVLFWHNHFTSSLKKVKHTTLMYQQNKLFRKHAMGNFSELLHAIIKDPAMLIYLDNRANKKSHPNENFARELLELFTLGEGNYSEKDIRELARALTGYSVDKDLKFRFKKRIHDLNEKVIFGQKGNFDADAIVDIILQNEATSIFIVKKLWLTFIGYKPDMLEVKRLAKLFRHNNYELKPLMQALFTSPYFTDTSTRGTMIKSPIELVVGTLRSFDYVDFDIKTAIQTSKRLGQDLLDPPNVKGWVGGQSWINTNTLLIRKGFLTRLTRGDAMKHLRYDLFELPIAGGNIESRAIKILLPLETSIRHFPIFKRTLKTILQHPFYQLK